MGFYRVSSAARNNGKVWEREVAKALGTTRTGPTGFGDPDVKYEHIAIECKYQSRLSLKQADVAQATLNAKGKPWALLLRERNTGTRLAVLPYDLFIELTNERFGTNV
jgi:hypothetical protein